MSYSNQGDDHLIENYFENNNSETPSKGMLRQNNLASIRSRQHIESKSAIANSQRSRPMSAMQKKAYSQVGNSDIKPRRDGSSRNSRAQSVALIQKAVETKMRGGLDEQALRSIWRGLGAYVAKQLTNGKGVTIPRFGCFTFTAAEVNLTGTTNPQTRDHQIREPVFMVGKDFVSGVVLKTGISHNRGQQIRPMALNGTSGIIPLVKINYVEVGIFCQQSKDNCRKGCEQMFRNLSDKTRGGQNLNFELPMVGRFIVRGNVAAIDFNQDLVEQTRGNTAKNHLVGNLFGSSNAVLNMNIHQADRNKLKPSLGMGGAIKIQHSASNWMKNNLDIDLDELPVIDERASSNSRIKSAMPAQRKNAAMIRSGSQSAFHKYQANATLSEANLNELNDGGRMAKTRSIISSSQGGRPLSAATYTTEMASHMSTLPILSEDQVMSIAHTVFQSRGTIISASRATGARFNLRDTISSTQIYQIYKRNGIRIELAHIKVLLRTLGLPFNGPSASLTLLMQACKAYIHGISGGYGNQSQASNVRSQLTPSEFSGISRFGGKDASQVKQSVARLRGLIRDIFYTSRQNLYEIFKIGMTGNSLDEEGFTHIVAEIGRDSISEQEVKLVFKSLVKNRNDKVTFQSFEEAFRSEEPTSSEFQTVVIRKVREWMFKNKLSSEIAFDSLCRSAGRFVEKSLTRPQFHRAMVQNEVGLSAVQIDALYANMTSDATSPMCLRDWQTYIYEDSDNPLQMIRETVLENELTQDDLLFQMKLRVWDNALDKVAFHRAMRNLDPSISDVQIKAIFDTLKNDQQVVPVCDLVRNFTGLPYETVDYRNEVFKKVYNEIYPKKEEQVIQLLQEADESNVGLIKAQDLLNVLIKVIKNLSHTELERFVRFLDKDKLGRINYMDFLGKVCKVSNKNHNPFKSLVSRLSYFLKQNNISAGALLKRLSAASPHNTIAAPGIIGIPTGLFAEFLKQKVEKKRSLEELMQYSVMLDVDKDGFVTEADIEACIKNLPNMAFFRNGGQALKASTFNARSKIFPQNSGAKLTQEKATAVCKQIKDALGLKRMQYRDAFNKFDLDKDGMVSFAEFNRGMNDVVELSVPIKEQIYTLMDKNNTGLISYEQFLDVLRLENFNKEQVQDNFDWEQDIITKIRAWIVEQRLTVAEAFKCFDKDFDGFISKLDLKESLTDILEINPKTIVPTKLDRLFRLMDFFKTGLVQVSDFQRLMTDSNPYAETRIQGVTGNMTRSLGGGLNNTSTFDWKFSVIQQIGLILSKKYASVEESFQTAAEQNNKLRFNQFSSFLDREQALQGFNLTQPLIQKLFSELDPHKKGFLNINDWRNAFKTFNSADQLIVELKNSVASTFSNCDSVFQFFLNFSEAGKQTRITYPIFEKAVNALTSERFKKSDIQRLWRQFTQSEGQDSMDRYQFREHFESMDYRGTSSVGTLNSLGQSHATSMRSSNQKSRTTIQTTTASSSQWENNVIERLRVIIATSTKSLREIFNEFDEDGNGFITQVEFRNAMRKLNLGITSREMDQVLQQIDNNGDGKIDWQEFSAKFKDNSFDSRMASRAAIRMAKLKELMNLHMTSANDAFRYFDAEKDGRITFADFSKLVTKAHELAGEKVPTYPIIKDLFDTIDVRKDGMLDLHEWQQTFGRVEQGCSKISFKTTALNMWENSREFERIGFLMAKNRKLLIDKFKEVLGSQTSKSFTFAEGKQALDDWLFSHFGNAITDDKLRCLFTPAMIHQESQAEPKYDYIRMLDINKSRHSGPQTV